MVIPDAKVQPVDETVDIDDLPALIDRATSEYLNNASPGYVLLLALPAGSGKTTAMVRLAETHAAGGRRVMYSGPRHDLFIDLMAMAERPDYWHHWQPRRQGQDELDTTCRWAPQMERWLSRGYEAMKFCHNPRICGYAYANDDCPYHAQRRTQKPIVYAMHQHVAVGHPLMNSINVLIGDELPLGAMLHPWLIPASHIVIADPDPQLERVLWTLRTLCERTAPQGGWSGPALLDELGGAAHVKELIEQHEGFDLSADALTPNLSAPEEVEKTDYLYLPTLLSLLIQECEEALKGSTDWIRRIHCTVDGLKLLLKRTPSRLPSHVIWCDATGDARMYEQLFGMPVSVVRPNVQMAGSVYQVYDSLNNRTALKDSAAKVERLKRQVAQIRTTKAYQNAGVITYKSQREMFEADGHFGAERGTNRLADRDALIVIGTPQPPQPQIVEIASMLYSDRMNPFNTTWSTRDEPYQGQMVRYSGFWDDPHLQVVLEQLREAELLQTLHRARPLRRRVDVWLLTNLPLRGIPAEMKEVRELFNAPPGVDPYGWPNFVEWARRLLDSHGMIVATDIAERLGVSAPTSRMYLYTLAEQLELFVDKVPAAGRGPRRAAILAPQMVKRGNTSE